MRILGIETSCDETAVAVVEDGRRLRSSVVGSQVALHAPYGGIVPEVASRQHLQALLPIYRQALTEAELAPAELDAVAVTVGPGLAGSLLVGINFAKGLALGLGLPLLGVNHLEGHIYAAWLEEGPTPMEEPGLPLVCQLASGGHTELILLEGHGRERLLGQTRDDAAGEAFDKAARLLGLGFPGGPEIQRAARAAGQAGEHGRAAGGVGEHKRLPWARMGDSLDFSFSGVKTALLRRAQEQGVAGAGPAAPAAVVASLAAEFQEAVVHALVEKSVEAVRRHNARGVLLGGGVAANTLLRQEMTRRSPVPVVVPRPDLCTDNGAMIAAAAFFMLPASSPPSPFTLPSPAPPSLPPLSRMDQDVLPGLRLGED